MISVNYRGFLGNNLFQYAFGRILAERMNTSLFIKNNKTYLSIFKNIVSIDRKEDSKEFRILNPNKYDISKLCECDCSYILNGFFQFYFYYKEYKKDIKEWFRTDDILFNINDIQEKDSLISLRVKKDMKRIVGENEYKYVDEMIEQYPLIPGYKTYVVSDDIDDDISKQVIKKFNAIAIPTDKITNFLTIQKFKRIYLSPSTYAWWAAWLSNADFICFPEIGFWHSRFKKTHNDLFVDDESRYMRFISANYKRWI